MKRKRITNLDVIKAVRKPMPPAKRVETSKFVKAKTDKTGRKAKHKRTDYV